jgi:hypothetical protein
MPRIQFSDCSSVEVVAFRANPNVMAAKAAIHARINVRCCRMRTLARQ